MKINLPNTQNNINRIIKKKESGFTIMELIVVIAVIGALSGALMNTINVSRQKEHASDGKLRQNLSDVVQAVETYGVAERGYPDGSTQNPLTGTDGTVASVYIGTWPTGFIYNEDGSDFSVHVEMASSATNYFKYSSAWKEIRECGDGGGSIDTVDECPALN